MIATQHQTHGQQAAVMLELLTRIALAFEQQNRIIADLSSAVCLVANRIKDLGGDV